MTNGRPRTHGHGTARLAGGYLLMVCLVRSGGGWLLEVETRPYDLEIGRRDPLRLSDQLLADLFRGFQQKELAAQSLAAGGRN